MTPLQLRQGDVLLEKIAGAPANLTPVPREQGRVILAHGEATGHAHAIKSRSAKLLQDAAGQRFLRVARAAKLEHDEHDTIALEPGDYKVIRQREYAPEGLRNVAD